MNKIEQLVKIADRLDQKGREDLANKVDAVINKMSHCGVCPEDLADDFDPTIFPEPTKTAINMYDRDPELGADVYRHQIRKEYPAMYEELAGNPSLVSDVMEYYIAKQDERDVEKLWEETDD